MNITNTINKAITAHEVMKNQAGNRIIVTFRILDSDGHTQSNLTSHYSDIAEIVAEWDKLIERYGESSVAMSSAHAEEITAYCKAN
jgi:hypothetical protein